MDWLLASLLVLPPRTGPLPLVGLKRDARRTELVSSCVCLSACVWPIQSCTIGAWRVLAARVLLTSRHGTAIFLTIIFALFCERVVHLHSSTQTRFWPEMGCSSTSFLARMVTAIRFLTNNANMIVSKWIAVPARAKN